MNTKESVALLLQEAGEDYVSGSTMAADLGITRTAVWKCIRQLEEEGFDIEAVRNRGYRLGQQNDILSPQGIQRYLGEYADIFQIEIRGEVTSTNDVLKEKAPELPGWYTLVANRQTKGKGRRTRSFYSPADTGMYLSMLIKLPLSAMEATRITTASAVAACRAIEQCAGICTQIKWVNDVFLEGKKICGILTEASISMENAGLDWAVMGIGFNIYDPPGGFPEEIAEIAGSISGQRRKDFRVQLAAAFMKEFYLICCDLGNNRFVEEYRKRSLMKNRQVDVIKGDNRISARALDIDDDLRLIVRYEDGSTEALSSGEVSIKL